ncbi:hypothetical protein DAMA08_045380 [Martiniozyma asiatica (nom. inval.)]|nr:hypothetical protein DAMA08_045380 [Martiniozyma asiatica]
MQFSTASLLSLVSVLAAANAENIAVALFNDINSNFNEYLSYIQAQTDADVTGLLGLYAEAQTYTDDSYTTLVDEAQLATISAFATGLPWYSSRIETALEAGATTAVASSTETAASSSSAEASSSSAEASSSSAEASSSSSSAEASSSSKVETSSSKVETTSSSTKATTASSKVETTSSTSSSSSVSTAGANMAVPGALAGLALGVIALL